MCFPYEKGWKVRMGLISHLINRKMFVFKITVTLYLDANMLFLIKAWIVQYHARTCNKLSIPYVK
jgi:hypothetical protein